MDNFRDVSALQRVLDVIYQKVPNAPQGQDVLLSALERWGWCSKEQATLYAVTVLSQNNQGSAARVAQYARELVGSWVRGTMQGSASTYLKTTQETWEFRDDLTYSHTYQSYEGTSINAWPNFQSSYSRPSSSGEGGIWAPGDWRDESGKLLLVTICESGRARQLEHRWTDDAPFYHRGCSINGEPFGRQI